MIIVWLFVKYMILVEKIVEYVIFLGYVLICYFVYEIEIWIKYVEGIKENLIILVEV